MRHIGWILVVIMFFCVGGCATSTSPAEQYKNYSDARLFHLGRHALARRNYSQAVKYFEALDALYPFGRYSQRADSDIIYAYYQKGDYAQALASANRYIHLYPRGKQADYAYYMKGLATIDENSGLLERLFNVDKSKRDTANLQQAFFAFRDLLQLFPHSKYAPDARQHMIYLRNVFAKHEMDVAHFYMRRRAYVAAANRATYVVQHYQNSPQVKQALAILVKANRALGLKKSADDALRVLAANYPHSRQYRRLARG